MRTPKEKIRRPKKTTLWLYPPKHRLIANILRVNFIVQRNAVLQNGKNGMHCDILALPSEDSDLFKYIKNV